MSAPADSLAMVPLIERKKRGEPLSARELEWLCSEFTAGRIPDYQVAAWLMAVRWRGMDGEETLSLTRAIVNTGRTLSWGEAGPIVVDKHSTGGVGDTTSLVVAPLAAACGVPVPMLSGRGLGHTGGTLDKLESIPGFRTALSLDQFRTQVADIGCALIGQTDDVAPADRTLYALRDVTATVESIPLICASILSKKIAEGIDALVLDVKTGAGAFLTDEQDARTLAEALVSLAEASGLQAAALLTAMDAPLGMAVGNALEIRECLDVLRGDGPPDVVFLCIELAAVMLRLGERAASLAEARHLAEQALRDGSALAVFRRVVDRQGGDVSVIDAPERLPRAPHRATLTASADGYVTGLHAGLIGRAAMLLGAGRARAEDLVDHAVGVVLRTRVGDHIRQGMPILDVHYRAAWDRDEAWPLLADAVALAPEPLPLRPLIVARLGAAAT
jgi:pyrimidine-nucleoside phosphorylase